MNNFNPKISVIVPIYNSGIYLKRCLDSLQKQKFKEFEVLMINDGSTDNSEVVCLNYSESDSRFKYFKKENSGKCLSVNYGYKLAKGLYISILDSDDYFSHNLLSKTFKTATKYNVDIVKYNYYYVKDGIKEKKSNFFPTNKVINKKEFKNLLKSDFNGKNMFLWFTWSMLIRKKLLDDFNIIHDEKLSIVGHDSTFNLKCYLNANSIYSINNFLYNYVYHSDSISQISYKYGLLEELTTQFHLKRDIYKNHNLNDLEFKNDFAKYYIEHSLIFLISNEKNSPQKLKRQKLIIMRNSEIYNYCFQYYKGHSKELTFKKKLTIFLFKHNFLRTLVFIHKTFGNN